MNYSIEIDAYSFHVKVNNVSSELSYTFRDQQNLAQQSDFRTGKPVNMASDWNGHMISSANHCARIPVPNPYCLQARQ